jgi:SAM-dependent methyltransferase
MSELSLTGAPSPPASSPFDSMAAGYDTGFTDTQIGMAMRRAVWQRMDARFEPGQRVLELNCGTGADALHLAQRGVHVLATDVAPGQVEVTRRKAEAAGMEDRITVRRLALEALAGTAARAKITRFLLEPPTFDGALSNFGGLNCVDDWRGIGAGLAACLRPGAYAMVCVMGPSCPWEWGWYLLHGEPGKAFRRLRPGGTSWRGLTIRYPSVKRLTQDFAPHFRLLRASAVGALIPPSYMEAWIARRPRLLARLNRWERRWETLPCLTALADHYLLEFQRLPAANNQCLDSI